MKTHLASLQRFNASTLLTSLSILLSFAISARAADKPSGIPAGYQLQYEQSFDSPEALKQFVFSDPKAWRHAKDGDNGALELFGKSDYNPKDRSPFNIALVADRMFSDFVLDVELQSTVKPYPHQDMCLFYGFEATNKFYYTHIAVAADPHAHNIFIVNGAPRAAIAKQTTQGVTWGENQWHKVRIERNTSAGTIKVYFDDFSKPIMVAEDKTFAEGCIGFGSFDDKGKIDNVKIWAPSATRKKTGFFAKPD
jgi:hypothetical protein